MQTQPTPRKNPAETGLLASFRRHWKWIVPAGAAAIVGVAWLAFGYFGIHTLFIDDEVNEAGPVFASGAGASGLATDEISDELADEMNRVADETDMPPEVEIDETMPAMDDAPEVLTIFEGSFVDRSHPTSGQAVVLNDGTEQRFLRFEDFQTDNGPDLNVYLTKADADADTGDFAADADSYIDLGDLKGNIGPQNYEIPADVDLSEFGTVVIWCVRFGVAFGAADIAPSAAA